MTSCKIKIKKTLFKKIIFYIKMSSVDSALKYLKGILESPIQCTRCDKENRSKEFMKMVLFLYDKIYGLTEEGIEMERKESKLFHEICFEEIYKEKEDKVCKAILEDTEDHVYSCSDYIDLIFDVRHRCVFNYPLFSKDPDYIKPGMYKIYKLYKLHTTGIITLDLFKGIENFEIN